MGNTQPSGDSITFLGTYALCVHLTIKPTLKKLQTLPTVIWIMVTVTAGLIGGIIHFIRFVSSPNAEHSLSIVLGIMLLLAGISAYLILLWLIRYDWKTKKR